MLLELCQCFIMVSVFGGARSWYVSAAMFLADRVSRFIIHPEPTPGTRSRHVLSRTPSAAYIEVAPVAVAQRYRRSVPIAPSDGVSSKSLVALAASHQSAPRRRHLAPRAYSRFRGAQPATALRKMCRPSTTGDSSGSRHFEFSLDESMVLPGREEPSNTTKDKDV